jgi:predicted CXXCH cytochrome family protein
MIRFVRLILLGVALTLAVPGVAGVRDTLHNLSAGGAGNVKSPVETRICIYCHISHSANEGAALWSRRKPAANYIPYSSSTIAANPGQPTGTSILCLSCHDGTIALGEVMRNGRARELSGNPGRMPPGKGLQGTDLSDDHPISFQYSADLAARTEELAMPETLDRQLRLDMNGELQCTTCHDAHDSPYEKLLVLPNIGSQLCVECHKESGWEQSSHSQSAATWNGKPPNPWRDNDYENVRDNACENCHAAHDADARARLLKHVAEEDNCADCHNGNVASKDVMAAFEMVSTHRCAWREPWWCGGKAGDTCLRNLPALSWRQSQSISICNTKAARSAKHAIENTTRQSIVPSNYRAGKK